MKLAEYIAPELVFVAHEPDDKPSFIKELVVNVKKHLPDIDDQTLLVRLLQREDDVSTGIGRGVAIPHAAVDGIDKTWCVITQIPKGLDFNSLDASPVHITFLLISPTGRTGTHLRILARLARLVSNEAFVSRIATAKEPSDIFALVKEEDGRHV